MRGQFMKEVAALGLTRDFDPGAPVSETDLIALPEPVQRYLRWMGVIGQSRDWSFRASFTGRFRRTPDERWMKCEAWQYNSRPVLARIFHLRIHFGGLVPVLGRDTYMNGRGRMLVKMLDLFTVADGKGEEFDIGELVTYLNDAVFIAPSMLLVPEVRWSPVDDHSFDVSLTDHGRTVTARVFTDTDGMPVNFSTTDRFCADPKDPKRLVRARWTTPIEEWRSIKGRQLWTRGQAVWDTPSGKFPYADFTLIPGSVAFNVAPGA